MQGERIIRLLITRIDAVADAIHAYRNKRDSHERARAKSDKITIRVLFATAFFAFLAAASSLLASWIFYGQLNVTKRESNLSERAFLDVEKLKVTNLGVLPGVPGFSAEQDVTWQFSPVFKNSGKTPAVNIRVVAVSPEDEALFYGVKKGVMVPGTHMDPISKRDYDRGAPNDPDIIFSWPTNKQKEFLIRDFTYIGPHQSIVPPSSIFIEYRMRDFQMWPWWFYFGSIHYDDFFGKPHISKFCFEINPAAMGGLGHPEYWVAITSCAHWNCMDASCKRDRAEFDAENSDKGKHP